MNRRDLFKRLVGMGAATIAAPAIAGESRGLVPAAFIGYHDTADGEPIAVTTTCTNVDGMTVISTARYEVGGN